MRGSSNRRQDEEISYWLSYSDMMAGLLLVFILIISLTVLRSKIQYDEKQNELLGKEQELIIQSKELENERLTIDEQGAKLNAQELKLSEQEGELLAQAAQLEEQKEQLEKQSALVAQLQDLMAEQQEKLDNIIGIRAELVKDLKKEFDHSSLNISVDEKSGAITMDSTILFAYNQSTLKSGGKDFLGDFMPRYLKILLSPKYNKYISEIVIEGHTDTSGQYLSNLELSQQRAQSVAKYCLTEKNGVLNKNEIESLQKVLSTSGKSFSQPVLDENGEVDMDASRRVEILFRLRDEEMIQEMIEILNETGKTNKIENNSEKKHIKNKNN